MKIEHVGIWAKLVELLKTFYVKHLKVAASAKDKGTIVVNLLMKIDEDYYEPRLVIRQKKCIKVTV